MRPALARMALLASALALACGRRRHLPPPTPLPQVPAPFPSASLSAGAPDIAGLVERVRPSVVNITAVHEIAIHAPERGWPFERWSPLPPRRFGGGDEILRQGALGSGFIIDAEGHVVTNAHVVDQADVVRVKLADDRDFRARILAKDEPMDVAVLQLEHPPSELPVASLGSSSALRVGDYVVAIGNPFGLGDTVTMGIVSATGRALGAGPYNDFIQTDASINPGNSGGPLFDLRGQVVGIDTAIAARGQGIGFAIPIDEVKRVLPELIAYGRIARGRLGATVQAMDSMLANALGLDRPRGALVAAVQPDGPASRAGIRPGDVILAVDGHELSQDVDLPRIIAEHTPGSRVRLRVLRDKQTREVEVTLGNAAEAPAGRASMQAPEPGKRGSPSSLGFAAGNALGPGALVEAIVPGGPAEGKLAPGDVIEALNGQPIADANDLAAKWASAPRGEPKLLRVRHEGQSRYVAIQASPSP
jgi:serine protease Do